VADACTFLETLVRQRSGKYNLSGPELIAHVFTLPTPMLTCNTLHSDSEILEQQGIMHLISGMLLSLRNPCGAERIGTDAEKALDCIAFLSFLAEIVEQARQA